MDYYNELDPKAAAWLRELIAQGHLPAGDVDERSIEDVLPSDLAGYRHCHFFAGIGGWAYALRLAGWPDDQPVWTGSCPCQPFSTAGKGAGFADERHLWPAWQHLIAQCRPSIVFGEQVASKDADSWIELVHADLEGMGYAFGCVPFPAAGVGAPHIRDRNYWVADSGRSRLQIGIGDGRIQRAPMGSRAGQASVSGGDASRMADLHSSRLSARREGCASSRHGATAGADSGVGWLADPNGRNAGSEWEQRSGEQRQFAQDGSAVHGFTSPLHGHWTDADWLLCRDGKWRPVEPGAFPLAHGLPARVVRLRGYGNAIVPQQAAAFIQASMRISQ